MTGQFDWHARLNIPLGVFQHPKFDHFILGVKRQHVLWGLVVEEWCKTLDDFALVADVLNRVQKGGLTFRWDVFCAHGQTPFCLAQASSCDESTL